MPVHGLAVQAHRRGDKHAFQDHLHAARGGHPLVAPFPGRYHHLAGFAGGILRHQRSGVVAGIGLGSPVIFVQAAAPLPLAGNDEETLHVAAFLEGGEVLIGQRKDGAGLHVPGVLVQGVGQRKGLTPAVQLAGGHVVPVIALGQPDGAGSQAGKGIYRLADDGSQNVVAEHELLPHGVGFLVLGVVVVHGTRHADAGIIGLAGGVVDVGREGIAQADGLPHGVGVLRRIGPDAALDVGALGGMGLENGREHAVLQPAGEDFRLVGLSQDLMAADVVAPVTVTYVGGSGGEIRQEGEGLPGVVAVSGEADLVAVAAQAAPAVIDHGTRGLFGAEAAGAPHFVIEEGVVEPEGVAQALDVFALLPLLPVQPPEIHALALQRVDDAVEVGIGPGLLVDAEGHGAQLPFLRGAVLAGLGVTPEVEERVPFVVLIALRAVVVLRAGKIILHEAFVAVLVGLDARSGM